MLGPFEVRTDDGALADVPGARLRAVLLALALEAGHPVPKSTLIDWVWGESPPSDAANALQRLVSRLRKALPDGWIEGQPGGGYRLLADPGTVDAVRFERLLGQARAADGARRARLLRDALALWRGTAMQDVELSESAAFDAAVTRLEALRLAALEDRFEAEAGLSRVELGASAAPGRNAELVAELTDAVTAHPLRERLAAALIRALAAAGRDSEALLAFERIREALADALGVDPSPELSALHVALLRGELGRREPGRATNLRAELTSFVGRDADVAAVRALIAGHRLTTVTGPGGAGKTRLATETARALLSDSDNDQPDPVALPDGAWLVELASVGANGDNGDVAQAALAALGVRDALLGGAPNAERGDEPADRLIATLRERAALLILDNCEHVIEPAAAFAHRVLGECRRVRILATSREPLGITGEALWPVEPLAESPAVRLLRDRAAAVRPDLAFDARTLATMAGVCRALDGMPLAIELTAARLRTMSLDQLASRLDDRFRLLTGGSRTALPHHRTLRSVVDWSWELLSDAERAVLRRLAVFSGGASLDAAEQVCAGAGVDQADVLDLLTALTEKSLLRAENSTGDSTGASMGDTAAPRYRMLDTIREYARDRLAEAGESEPARQAHLAYFADLAQTADPHLRRAEQLSWLAALEAEHDNIAAALRGALAAGEAAGAMRLAAGAGWYWWLAGHKAEGLELITATVGSPGEVDDETRALVYALGVTFLTDGPGDQYQAQEWIHQAYRFTRASGSGNPLLGFVVALERLLTSPADFAAAYQPLLADDDPWVRALARLQLAKMRIALGQGDREVDDGLEQALAEFRALGERWGISFALTELADRTAIRGEFATACDLFEQAVAVLTELGASEDVIWVRARQGQLFWLLGDAEASAATMAEAQRHAERAAWPSALAWLAMAAAKLAYWRGDPEEVRRQLAVAAATLGPDQPNTRAAAHDLLGYLADSLDESRAHRRAAFAAASEAGYAPTIAQAIVGVADLALRAGQHEQAARLLAASAAVGGLPDRTQPDAAGIERQARRRLGGPGFAEASREGAQSSWPELVEAVLGD